MGSYGGYCALGGAEMIPEGMVIGALCVFLGFMLGAYLTIWLIEKFMRGD